MATVRRPLKVLLLPRVGDESRRTGPKRPLFSRTLDLLILQITIIIPALNERNKIERDLESAHAFLTRAGLEGEIIVVTDGSTDDTSAVAAAMSERVKALRVLPQTTQRGKGAAVKRGVASAQGAIIMFADAGLCVPFEDALQGIALLDAQACELAHGSRSDPKTVLLRVQPLWRQVGSRLFRHLIYLAMGIPRTIGDTQCGFKLYRADIARDRGGTGTEFEDEVGKFGTLLYAGKDWKDRELGRQSMILMAEKVMPRINAAGSRQSSAAE